MRQDIEFQRNIFVRYIVAILFATNALANWAQSGAVPYFVNVDKNQPIFVAISCICIYFVIFDFEK